MQIIRYIANETLCPQCLAHLPAEEIEIESVEDATAFICYTCNECNHSLFGQVMISQKEFEQLESRAIDKAEISIGELLSANTLLNKHAGDISALFPPQQ